MTNPEFPEKTERLKTILRTMFQLDRGDLDFGLYRIMNLKSGEVSAFLDNDLLPQVQAALAEHITDRRDELKEDLAESRKQAANLRVDPESTPRVKDLRRQLADAEADAAVETDVYNHLANFFARYYDEGDFMSLRRYSGAGQSTYLIPYNGEEVTLHWANADQYYIKSTENYASYIFTVGTGTAKRRVRFETVKADNEKDNVKAVNGRQRRFLLAEGGDAQAVEHSGDDLVVSFEHRPMTAREKKLYAGNGATQQAHVNEAARERIRKALPSDWAALLVERAPTESDPDRTVLDKHLAAYTAKNSFDYFIHKDLGGFLRRELDIYLKNDVLNLDDLALGDAARLHRALVRTRVTRYMADKIITFLAQLEEFQKQLWLKKKFVLETQYCVTLDRVPESLYAEIAANEAQRAEWVALFAIDGIKGDLGNGNTGYTNPLTAEFLKANPYLVLDTRHFNQGFTDRLLAGLSAAGPLEDQVDGLLIHGENFQALNLLQARYRERVQCVHIDPPYNTRTSGFMYKNGYRHSSWLAMMDNRIVIGNTLLGPDGVMLCHIDENEYEKLHLLLERIGIPDLGTIVWDKRNPMTGGGGIATQHEYVICRSKSDDTIRLRSGNTQSILNKAKELVDRHGGVSNHVKKAFSTWVSGNTALTEGEKAYHYIDDEGRVYSSVSLRAPERRTDPKFFEPLLHPSTGRPCAVPPNGFSRTPGTLRAMVGRGEILFGADETTQPRQKRFLEEGASRQLSSVIQDARRGKTDLDKLGLENFPYCHSVSFYEELLGAVADGSNDVVLDYFAGSGTSGHAVINLNREDGGQRKCILVEVGQHFEYVLLPRLKKVVYSPDWKDGRPVSRQGSTQLFKYIRLESYEDTLDSLELTPRSPAQKDLLAEHAGFAEDYHLRYALGTETAASACLLGQDFNDPFAYTLSIVREGLRTEVPVDLPETFNYLIGLRVGARLQSESLLAVTGTDAEGRPSLVLWRNLNETDNATLDNWFTRNRERFGTLEIIYVNGDHTLNAVKQPGETWVAESIEPVFRELMFAGSE